MSRKHLDELLRDLKELNKNPAKPEIQYVMVDDIDRMARDITVWVTKKVEIEATGAKILSLKQSLDDTPEAHLMETISMATKQYERENN
jgi:DNA invertase Pin-like site-specific DNA recombinase